MLAILRFVYAYSTETALSLDAALEKVLTRLQQFKNHCPPLENIPGFRR